MKSKTVDGYVYEYWQKYTRERFLYFDKSIESEDDPTRGISVYLYFYKNAFIIIAINPEKVAVTFH